MGDRWTYRRSDGPKSNLTDALSSSSVYLILATANYLSDVEGGDARVTNEISMMKALKKNVLLVWVVNPGQLGVQLDEDGREKLRAVFKDFPKVMEAEFDAMDPTKSWGIIGAIRESLE